MHPHLLFRRLDRKLEFPAAPAPSARSCSNITTSDRPARTVHDAGDHRTVEPGATVSLPATPADLPGPCRSTRCRAAHAGDTIRMRAPSRREWLPFNGSQIRLLETEDFCEPS